MDEKVHEYILNEILRYFEIDERTAKYLIEFTSRPDRKAFENIKSLELPPAKEWYEHVENSFLYAGNAAAELLKWAILHTSHAPEQFIMHFEIAKEILVDSPSKDRVRKEKGLKNLAYAVHYIVDVGTPYHSVTLMDLQKKYYEKIDGFDGSDDEWNELHKEFLIDLFTYVAGHTFFEKKLLYLFENQPYRRPILNAVNTKVRSINKVPEFKYPEELVERHTNYIAKLKKVSQNGYENIDYLFKCSTVEKSENCENELNEEILNFSKWCISNITVAITVTLLSFFDKREKKNPKTYIKIGERSKV